MINKLLRITWVRRTIFFFPVQLFFVHLKKNHLQLLFWALLFGFINNAIAPRYGVPFLFLEPEYLNKVSFVSYFIVGFACGGFIMAFNISSYVMNGFRFPFIATLYSPFVKYCMNNSIIPLMFCVNYTLNIVYFLYGEKIYSTYEIASYVLALLLGIFLFIFISITYFFRTNKNIFKLFGVRTQDPESGESVFKKTKKREEWKNYNLIKEDRDWYAETYLGSYFQLRLVRPVKHYKKVMLRHVFKQNHRNASRFGFFAITSLIILGLFQMNDFFIIPAGASVFLLFTMFLMLSSAMYSYFRGWANTILLLLLVGVNVVFKSDFLGNSNKAYGIDYSTSADYSYSHLKRLNNDNDVFEKDIATTLITLNKWKEKNFRGLTKPKLVIINTSGGGLRSTLWTMYVMQHTDSALNGNLLKNTFLISGSSGGMIGAAYMRELYLLKQQSPDLNIYSSAYRTNAAKDILNPIAFSIATNELFFGLQTFKDAEYRYSIDRAYAFEKQLNTNTSYILDKRLIEYKQFEENADIPVMIFSPTIINDGRKLLISSSNISYLTRNNYEKVLGIDPLYDGIEYSRFFEEQNAMNVKFTSVLRMSATFPYISPVVTLPSNPQIEILDAGMRDNYGVETTVKFIYTFRKWIEENTSGVVFIQIRDRHKERPIQPNPPKTLAQRLTNPLGGFYGNLFSVQDYTQNQMLQYLSSWLKTNIDVVDFQLYNELKDNISLSWHLTNKEKQKVLNSINIPDNKKSVERLKQLLR